MAGRKVLFIAANYSSFRRLALLREAKHAAAELRGHFEFDFLGEAAPDDLQAALLHGRPSVLHFSGHGHDGYQGDFVDANAREFNVSNLDDLREGIIMCSDPPGEARIVGASALAAQLSAFAKHIRLVVLNACHSIGMAEELTRVIDFAIGVEGPVRDEAARRFSKGLYRGIAAGETLSSAFSMGVAEVAVGTGGVEQDADRFVLRFRRGSDPSTVVLERLDNLPAQAVAHAAWNSHSVLVPIQPQLDRLREEHDKASVESVRLLVVDEEWISTLHGALTDLFDLVLWLRPVELRVLAMSIRLSAYFEKSGADLPWEHQAKLRGAEPIVELAQQVVELSRGSIELRDGHSRTEGARLTLLAALLRFGRTLLPHRELLHARHVPPTEVSTVEHWIAWTTRSVTCTSRIMILSLEIPGPGWVSTLKALTVYRIEAAWQRLRGAFVDAGMVMAVAPAVVIIGTNDSTPPEHLSAAAGAAMAAFPAHPHLGGNTALALMPHPDTFVSGDVDTGGCVGKHRLEISKTRTHWQVLQSCGHTQRLIVPWSLLRAAEVLYWRLVVDDDIGGESVAGGRLVALSHLDRADATAHCRGRLDRWTRWSMLGMFDALLAEAWPLFERGLLNEMESIPLLRALHLGFCYLYDYHPHSNALDAYRGAHGRVRGVVCASVSSPPFGGST